MTTPNSIPLCTIPLTIAVAGDHGIDHGYEPEIAWCIREKLQELGAGNADRVTPLRCLSSLSNAADMLFAEEALGLGLEVVAVLAAPPEILAECLRLTEKTPHAAQESENRFLGLVAKCADVVVLGETALPGTRHRNATVGRYLARHSHILFALWDKGDDQEEGSTGHIVSLFQNGYQPERRTGVFGSVLDCPEPQRIYHLLVKRHKDQPLRPNWWQPSDSPGAAEQALARRRQALERFNQQARLLASDDATLLEHAAEALSLTRLPEDQHVRRLLGVFAMADTLAVTFRDRTWRTLNNVFLSAALMLVSFALYSNIDAHPALLGLYIFGFSLGCAALLRERKAQGQNQFLDYRVLAEALRIQIFFRFAGLDATVGDQCLRKLKSEVAWIRDALRCLDSAPPATTVELEMVKRCWIDAQNAYYSSRSRKEKTIYVLMENGAKICLALGLVLAAFLFVATLRFPGRPPTHGLHQWILMSIGFLPALAAILSGYIYRRGLEAHTKESDRMQPLFQRAAERVAVMSLPRDAADFQEIVEELGLEALAENVDWLMLHRGRPIPIPQ